ncbi:LuxR C-terminal-related transcriptional regulator [Brachymonas chironomi]|uniref:LuxR C-terminal-related transcriptional regulator n=1 Tax=Brachymonas chironomi TaxID=491919 RepID=UPI0003827185|nr:response regulator transcription factor [Brachymonas chironomi]
MSYFIIEDHPLYREALSNLIRRIKPGSDVVELERLGSLPLAVKTHGEPDAILLDLTLSDTLGYSGIREIRHHYPSALVITVSDLPDGETDASCLEAGSDAYLPKQLNSAELYSSLRQLLIPDSVEEENTLANSKLSKRQVQLLAALEEGLSNRDIAERLGISEHTVKVHLWRLFRRLGVKSRTQAIHTARLNGLFNQ